jgi:hypothetical protein
MKSRKDVNNIKKYLIFCEIEFVNTEENVKVGIKHTLNNTNV